MKRSSPAKLYNNGSAVNGVYHRTRDPSVNALKKLPQKPQVAIYEPALELDSFGQSQGALAIHKVVVRYLAGWFQFPTLQTWNHDIPAKLLVVDEVHLPTLLAQRPEFLDTIARQSVIILAANPARQAILSKDIQSPQVEVLCKPFGPYKLAKTICRAMEKAALAAKPAVKTEYIEIQPSQLSNMSRSVTPMPQPGTEQLFIPGLLGSTSSTTPLLSPQVLERLNTGQSRMSDVSSGPDGCFPFPSALSDFAPSSGQPQPLAPVEEESLRPQSAQESRSVGSADSLPLRPRIEHMKTEPAPPLEEKPTAKPTSNMGAWVMETSLPLPEQAPLKPRLLIVDDNKINLRMLHTYVRKKGFKDDVVDLADDGAKAVDIFKRRAHAKDWPAVVFMDISMPVMDGYEATRAIRHFENRTIAEGGWMKQRSLIVAVTGNAGGYDQSEAFASGVDIFMTKPVSFKEVGKILDNWRE
jgi:CheY-like chemotaxis protein